MSESIFTQSKSANGSSHSKSWRIASLIPACSNPLIIISRELRRLSYKPFHHGKCGVYFHVVDVNSTIKLFSYLLSIPLTELTIQELLRMPIDP